MFPVDCPEFRLSSRNTANAPCFSHLHHHAEGLDLSPLSIHRCRNVGIKGSRPLSTDPHIPGLGCLMYLDPCLLIKTSTVHIYQPPSTVRHFWYDADSGGFNSLTARSY